MHDTQRCCGIDLGGTKLAAALGDESGRVRHEIVEPTDPRGGQYVAEQIVAAVARLATLDHLEPPALKAVVIGVPGVVDARSQRLSQMPHVAGFAETDVAAFLGQRLKTHVELYNDVNLAMLGEHAIGGAVGCRHAAFLSLGTGVGLGLLLDGRIYSGATGAAGEIADLPQAVGTDGKRPTLEAAVGSPGIINRYRRAGGGGAATVREIFARLADADPAARSVLDAVARDVARAIVTLQALLDLERIVLGGSIGLRPELLERVVENVRDLTDRPIQIAASALGDKAGLHGAVVAASRAGHRADVVV